MHARSGSTGRAELRETREELQARLESLEVELEWQRASYVGLVENLHDIVFALDAEGAIASVGGNTMGILGLAPHEAATLTAARWRALVHPDDLPGLQERAARCLSAPQSETALVRVRDVAGEFRWIEVSMCSLEPEGGAPLGVGGVARDVADRIHAERMMASLNRAAERVQDSSLAPQDVLVVVTSELADLELSALVFLLEEGGEQLILAQTHGVGGELAAIEDALGRPIEGGRTELASAPTLRAVLEERRPQCLPFTPELASQCFPEVARGAPSAAAGALLGQQVVVAPMVSGNDALGLLLVYGQRVRPRMVPSVAAFANQAAIAMRNAQLVESLRGSEEQYRSIFESVTDGLTIFDEDGYILEVNPAACRIYGYARDELVGMHLSGIVHPDYYHGLRNFRRGIERDGIFRAQALNIRKDGTTIEVEITGTAFTYKGRRRLLSVDTDITERMQSHRALLRSEKLRALGQMAGGIAHDFNNLLGGIQGFINLALLEMGEAPEQAREDLERALASTGDAAEAVRRLQSLYRQTEDTSDFRPVYLDQLVREVVALTQPRWKDEPQFRGVTVNLLTDLGDARPVMGNAAELRRVLTNLVLNAVDAMPQGGTLAIGTRDEGDESIVSVSDTGVGMSEELQAQLFEPFFTTKGTAGSGLGLAVSSTIVARHGGRIDVDSRLYEGSTFTVRLPSARAGQVREVPAEPAVGARSGERPSLHVLAVDDEESVLNVLTRLLQRDGQRVTTATSGREAIARLREGAFDLLITDLGMPNVSGHQVAHVARELYPSMPIVLSTGWGETVSPDQLVHLGATALLPKPFTYEDLQRIIDSVAE